MKKNLLILILLSQTNLSFTQETSREQNLLMQSNQESPADKLIKAVIKNDKKELINLIDNKDLDVNSQDKNGITALMAASITGNKEIISILLDRKANTNVQSKDGSTALMATAIFERILIQEQIKAINKIQNVYNKIRTILIAHKADPNIINKEGKIMRDYLLNNKEHEILDNLNKTFKN